MLKFHGSNNVGVDEKMPGFKHAFSEDYLQQDLITATVWQGEKIATSFTGQGSTYGEALSAAAAKVVAND